MTLGQYLKELRRQRHLTQRQLAEQVGVDFSYLSKIENDRLEHTPSLKRLQDLAKALEVDELELMELADKVPPDLLAYIEPSNGPMTVQPTCQVASRAVRLDLLLPKVRKSRSV